MEISKMKKLLTLLIFTLPVFSYAMDLKYMPVQHGGRVKPFDTLASESVRLVYGKTKYEGKEPSVLVLTWLLAPEVWAETEFVQIKNRKLKKTLGLDIGKDFFSQKSLSMNPSIESLLQNLQVKLKKEVKLNAFDQALSRLQGQLMRLNSFQSGSILKLAPQEDSGKAWLSVNEFNNEYQQKFGAV